MNAPQTKITAGKSRALRVAILGAGRAGSAVGRAFRASGADVVMLRRQGSGAKTFLLEKISAATNIIFIAVPDAAIAEIARQLALQNLPWKKITVAHLSGALTRDVLARPAARGGRTMALHPAFPFISKTISAERLIGIGWGIDCANADWKLAEQIVKRIGGVAVRVPSAHRMEYHVACAMIANSAVTISETAIQIATAAGLSQRDAERVLDPLLAATVKNIFSTRGQSMRARLTGPVARGDDAMVQQHLRSIKKNPAMQKFYSALVEQTKQLLQQEAEKIRKQK